MLLRRQRDLDAVSCGSDQITRGACDRLRELGRTAAQRLLAAVAGREVPERTVIAPRLVLRESTLGT